MRCEDTQHYFAFVYTFPTHLVPVSPFLCMFPNGVDTKAFFRLFRVCDNLEPGDQG